jgi:hypothetical protein
MYIVEVRRDGDELAGPMGRMRDWLDAQQIEPRLFEFDGTIFRLEFATAREAAAFAHAFDGQVGGDRGKLAA